MKKENIFLIQDDYDKTWIYGLCKTTLTKSKVQKIINDYKKLNECDYDDMGMVDALESKGVKFLSFERVTF